MMKFVAYDCSSEELIVLASNGVKMIEERISASGTENLLPLIDKVLKKLKMKIGEVEQLMIGIGPGSWTGARVAVVTAYGLFEANKNLKISTFNSFDLISYNGNETRPVIKLVKAYANFVYVKSSDGVIEAITKDELKLKYQDCLFISKDRIFEDVLVCDIDIKMVVQDLQKNEKFVLIDDVEPMYLRLSQAEYQRNEKLKKGN